MELFVLWRNKMEYFNLYDNGNYILIVIVIGLICSFLFNWAIKILSRELEKKELKEKDNKEE